MRKLPSLKNIFLRDISRDVYFEHYPCYGIPVFPSVDAWSLQEELI